MTGFLGDVRAQGDVVRRVVATYRGELAHKLEDAARIVNRAGDRPILLTGMGSSLYAGRVLPPLFSAHSRLVVAHDAGELLHYGLGGAEVAGAVVAISQSGRSIETLRAVDEFRQRSSAPIVALTNDLDAPLTALADVTLPLLAGSETAVATKTYVAAMVVSLLLASRVLPGSVDDGDLESAAAWMAQAAVDERLVRDVAGRLVGRPALVIVGRGPSLSVADYAALTIKEMAACPAEAMSGGAFRHGPLELTVADVGVVVLAPSGRTADLGIALAIEVAERGRDVWLLTDASRASTLSPPPTLLTTTVPSVPEALSPLAALVPLQLLAAEMAKAVGREAGSTIVATKVTERQ